METKLGTWDESTASQTFDIPCGPPVSESLDFFRYAAKFVCGVSVSKNVNNALVAPGHYFTTINVHNADNADRIEFRKRFSIALPRETQGPRTVFYPASLDSDRSLDIECADIYHHTGRAPNSFLTGFAILESPGPLDVVGVYTAGSHQGTANPDTGPVSTFHMERVPAVMSKPSPPCPPTPGPITVATGTSAWTVRDLRQADRCRSR